MTKLFKSGTRIRVQDIYDEVELVPGQTYNLGYNYFDEYLYLESSPLKLPSSYIELYPDIRKKITKRFSLNESFSVLFSGISGSGKSILAKSIAMESGLPIITINDKNVSIQLPKLKAFIETVGPCIIIFDEYEKTFEAKAEFLEFFDGNYKPTVPHYNFVIVNKEDINEYMKRRPGRLFYNFKFESLPENFVKLMVNKFLQSDRVEEVIEYFETRDFISADIIITVCNEADLFPDISVEDLAKDLNI